MTRFLPDDEMLMTNSVDGYFQKALDKSLLHARCFVSGISTRITIALIYYHSNPACTDLMLFAKLLERGAIPIVCRCRLCVGTDERLIKGSVFFLSHLLVDVHASNLTTDRRWFHVPPEELRIVDFSTHEVPEVLGFDHNSSVVFH